MNKWKSTLDGFEPKGGRAVGNSTRQVDLAIQYLFEGYVVRVEDHATINMPRGNQRKAFISLLNKITRRLASEHGLNDDDVKVDLNLQTIQLI